MKYNFTFSLLLLLASVCVTAQGTLDKRIKGQVTSNGIPLEGINILNTSNINMVVSDSNGSFSVLVNEGDILIFSAVNYETLRKYINTKEFKTGNILVDLTPKSIELNEVFINTRPDITAENLGIIPKNQIKLTPAERKLQTAGDFKPTHLLGVLGGALAVDPILNAISGRTKMLKKAVSVEKKEFLMLKLQTLFEDKYYLETLKISKDYVRGFQYYCVEDPDFVESLKVKNKAMCMFLIVGLATKYKKDKANDTEVQ